MSTPASKSPITHPVAKRFMVVFAAVALIGLFTAPVYQNDLLFAILGIGMVGFTVSAFFAVDKKIDQPYSPPEADNAQASSESGCLTAVGGIISVVCQIAIGLGLLWGLIAVVKWMWIHS